MKKFYLSLPVAIVLALAPPNTGSIAVAAEAGNPERGFETFMRVGCFQCHGTVGQGPISGPKLAPDPLPLDALRAYIRAPAQVMPPYVESVLSDQDVADIHAYLETIPPSPAVEDTILAQ